jgi:RNA-directed DNA polymerase
VALYIEPELEPIFHTDSYGYRPGRSALQAVGVCRERCWQRDWVIDLDIKAFFDTLDHDLVLRAVRHHTDRMWIHLYVERWLMAPLQREDGMLVARDRGSPQGSAVSPLLANLFMHYAFDAWMERTLPYVWFERYVDDVVLHCKSELQARKVLSKITERLAQCKLDINPAKTHIVYCKDGRRRSSYATERFDFLGYTFRPRRVKRRNPGAQMFIGFCPAVSDEARKTMSQTIRRWRLHLRSGTTLQVLARTINPIVRGWINYYGRYYPSMLFSVLDHINVYLVRWAQRKFKRLRRHPWKAWRLITKIARCEPRLFAHWSLGVRPTAG